MLDFLLNGEDYEVRREGEELVLYLDAPGATKESTELSVDSKELNIRYEKKRGDTTRRVVRRFSFARDDFDHDKMSAKLEDGILAVHLPILKSRQRRVLALT